VWLETVSRESGVFACTASPGSCLALPRQNPANMWRGDVAADGLSVLSISQMGEDLNGTNTQVSEAQQFAVPEAAVPGFA